MHLLLFNHFYNYTPYNFGLRALDFINLYSMIINKCLHFKF